MNRNALHQTEKSQPTRSVKELTLHSFADRLHQLRKIIQYVEGVDEGEQQGDEE